MITEAFTEAGALTADERGFYRVTLAKLDPSEVSSLLKTLKHPQIAYNLRTERVTGETVPSTMDPSKEAHIVLPAFACKNVFLDQEYVKADIKPVGMKWEELRQHLESDAAKAFRIYYSEKSFLPYINEW